MKHKDAVLYDDLHSYLDDRMNDREKREYEEKLRSDPALFKKAHVLKEMRRALCRYQEDELESVNMEYFFDAVQDRIRSGAEKKHVVNRVFALFTLPRLALGTAAIFLLIYLGFGAYNRGQLTAPGVAKNECYVEYIDNKTSQVMIFKSLHENMTIIWVKENPAYTAENNNGKQAGNYNKIFACTKSARTFSARAFSARTFNARIEDVEYLAFKSTEMRRRMS